MGYIYKISNNIDDRVYIGSTINLNSRWREHKRKLLNNIHENVHLQRFVNKYGLDCLSFDIIEEVNNDVVLVKEQYYLDITTNKFNIAINSSAPMMGKHHTEKALEKIAIRSKGYNNPMFGKKRPQWIIDKLTTSSLGRTKSKEEKIKRMIILPNRTEITIEKNNEKIFCFSLAHASKLIGVSQQSVSEALKNKTKAKGWSIYKSTESFYNKELLLTNIHLFDDNCHPQPELIEMLKTLKSLT